MNIIDVIQDRRAYRAYDPEKPVEKELMEACVAAAHLAPSYGNKQPWRWILLQEGPGLDQVKKALTDGNYWAWKAPAFAVLVTSESWTPAASGNRPYAPFSAGLSAMNFMLQGTALGLIAHPIAGFDPETVKSALGIPAELTPMLLVSLGYPGDKSTLRENHRVSEEGQRVRLPLETIYAWDSWEEKLLP